MKPRVALLVVVVLVSSACGGSVAPSGSPASGRTPSPGSTAPAATATTPGEPTATLPIGAIREVRADVPRGRAGSPGDLAAVVDGDAAFAFDLYAGLTEDTTGDVFFSPYSISTALSMTYAGARDSTADQLAAALRIADTADRWHAGRNTLELDLGAPPPPKSLPEGVVPLTLEAVNTLFGQDGFPFEPAYLETLAASYGAGLQAVDFAADPDAGRAAINGWVSERTRDRIPELMPPGTITASTAFVLVNAIFFKATWADPFLPERTTPEPFHLLDGSTVAVPTMHGVLRTSHAAGDGWQAVRLPYVGASMLVVVPDAGRFTEVEDALDLSYLRDVQARLEAAEVTLALPRWESDLRVELKPFLTALGIVDLFDADAADLTGIASAGLFVSHVIHQANVTVDEVGTEAAAATAVVGDTSGGPDRQVTLTVDRPWIYAILDDSTGEILFLGRVMEPSEG